MNKPLDDKKIAGTRRGFLLGATVGTVGAVAVAVASSVKDVAEVAAPAASGEKTKAKGYHLTAHIQQYYDTTRTL
jgi:hypothetical protein